LGIGSAIYLMTQLERITWEVMIGWLLIGLVIYFTYSQKHSKVQKMPAVPVAGD
jgi:basic amino acid/polyamine antiporter, APA family